MSLTDNALRKLQRNGLFAVGPAVQPPADPQQPPTPTDPPAAEESASDSATATSVPADLPEVAESVPDDLPAAAESFPVDNLPEVSLPPLPTALPEPRTAECRSEPQFDAPAYDPVIQPYEDSAPTPAFEPEAETRDDDLTWGQVPQSMDEADLDRLPEDVCESQDTESLLPDPSGVSVETPAVDDPLDAVDDSAAFDLPELVDDQAVDGAIRVEEFTAIAAEEMATDLQGAGEAEALPVQPAAEVTASMSLPYEQLALDRLSQPDYAEPFLLLQNTLLRRCGFRLPASLLTVSPQATARSAELVVHLSLLWGESDKEILMVDANLEEQTLTRQLDALGQPGLCDILTGTCSPGDLVRSTSQTRLHFIPCGDDTTGISREPQQLDVRLLQQVIEQWCHHYHQVLIDVGPIGASLAAPLAELCEASLLVVCMQDVALAQVQSAARRCAITIALYWAVC